MRFSTLTLFAFVALPAIACTEDVNSTDVKTSGVYADMSVTAKGNGSSEVAAGLKVGGSNSNTYMNLDGADELIATVGDESKAMSGGPNYYKTTFATDAADTAFVIAFNRGPDDIQAPNSTVSLPAPFTIAGIATGDSISRAAGLTATWTAATDGDSMRWSLDGDCLFATNRSLTGDTGTVTVATADFSVHSGDEQTSCPANFCVARTRSGTVDPNFGEGGVIDAEQQRCVAFTSAP
jgi:hypothetical protein